MKDFDEFEDDYGDQDLSKLTLGNLNDINSHINKNYDPRTKTVGDRIMIWDTSRLTDAETGKFITYDFEHHILTNYPCIVIEDHCPYHLMLQTLAGDFTQTLDLIVWSKQLNKKYRTSSEFVKLI